MLIALSRQAVSRVTIQPPVLPQADSAIAFLTNAAAGSDIRIQWVGSNYVGRSAQTCIWQNSYTEQNSFYATFWESGDDDAFRGVGDFGRHPYPTDGSFDSNGDTTGNSGTPHYYEIAGVRSSVDHIATGSAGSYGAAVLLVTDTPIFAASTVERISAGTVDRHRYWPNVANASTFLEVLVNVADYPAGVTYKQTVGASPWRKDIPSAGRNDETHYGWIRGIQVYQATKTIAQIQTLAALTTNAAVIAHADAGNLWYLNLNPTHDDISDKSGNAHHPGYANANRPTTVTP